MLQDDRRRNNALRFILLMGVVSLFADMTYEGSRSIAGPFLTLLGAGAAAVGLVSGLGELVGYALRLASGYVADRTRQHWLMTILGYGVSLLAVPLLAVAGSWELAAWLLVSERLGKALRTPARDAMLSHAARQVGTGWGFGLHELMDQIGALAGPAITALILYLKAADYRTAFLALFVPAALALSALFLSRYLYPEPQALEAREAKPSVLPAREGFPSIFWLYLLFTVFSIAGFAHFQVISYHFKAKAIVPDHQIPLFFAVAMGVDALVALPVGRLFDRKGLLTLTLLPLAALPVPLLVFSMQHRLAFLGMILWGAAMGIQETIMRAALAEIVPGERRGVAYGMFNAAYGLAWFLGSTAMGVLYGVAISYVMLLATALELASLAALYRCLRAEHQRSRG